jgi:hypothetical protein
MHCVLSRSERLGFFFIYSDEVRLSSLDTSVTIWPLVQAGVMDDEYGAVGGMSGRGNQSKKIYKVVPVLNVWVRGCVDLRSLDLGTSSR